MPSLSDPPAGCRFHTRCPDAMPVCGEIEPHTAEVSPGHTVTCHKYN
ncbi:MAG: hypothetical protein LBS19_16080 [Clostridiales bacterium]|nr:hypothetical protein [Clostridiales bacterium]